MFLVIRSRVIWQSCEAKKKEEEATVKPMISCWACVFEISANFCVATGSSATCQHIAFRIGANQKSRPTTIAWLGTKSGDCFLDAIGKSGWRRTICTVQHNWWCRSEDKDRIQRHIYRKFTIELIRKSSRRERESVHIFIMKWRTCRDELAQSGATKSIFFFSSLLLRASLHAIYVIRASVESGVALAVQPPH